MKKPTPKGGYSLIEVIISVGLLAIVGALMTTSLTFYRQAAKATIEFGSHEDVRRYIKQHLSCAQTITKESAACQAGGPILGLRRDGSSLFPRPGNMDASTPPHDNGAPNPQSDHGPDGKSPLIQSVKLFCQHDGQANNITAQITPHNGAPDIELFDVPIVCPDVACAPEPAWEDPMLFPSPDYPRPVSSNSIWHQVNARLKKCFDRELPPDDNRFLRARDEPYRGHNAGFNNGTEEIHSLTTLCNILGYDQYDSSTCEDDAPRGANRCNFTSPHNNVNTFFSPSFAFNDLLNPSHADGDLWQRAAAPYTSWVVTMTCSGKR